MARESGRESPEVFPALPNILLIVVLVLLLAWGVAGLYLPETTGVRASGDPVLASDTVPPSARGEVALEGTD